MDETRPQSEGIGTMDRIETMFVKAIEDTLNEACVINAELRTENEEIKKEYAETNHTLSRVYAKSCVRSRIIHLLKSRIRRLEKKVQTWRDVSNSWEEMYYLKKYEADNRAFEIKSLKSQLDSANAKIAAAESAKQIDMCEVEADFTEIPDIIGIAPCGNGCPVKRDGSGRMYDAHEIGCEDHEEYELSL